MVENIGGAGSTIGVASVARAQPDGYTLLVGNSGNQVVAPIASARLPYDPLRDFDAIYRLAITGLAIAVHPSIPAQRLKDIVDYAKANPGKLAYASAGVGTTNHFVGEMFKLVTDTQDITHVPYRGAGPATNDLLGGQVPLMWATVTGQLIQLHNSGKLRVLAVTSPKRLIGAPDIPTTIEAGFVDLIWEGFVGLFTPKGTPAPIIERIAQVSRTVLTDPDLQKNWIEAGMEPDLDSTPAKARQFVEDEIRRLSPIVKATEFKLN